MRTYNTNRGRKSGFTLIELLIVVGIISLLIVVLAAALLPWLGKSDERRAIAMIENFGGAISGGTHVLDEATFKRDAGTLSGRISSDPKTRSSQMLLFYLAPSRSTWETARFYKDRGYAPTLQPEQFQEQTREEGGGLPFVVDPWERPIWYNYDAVQSAHFLYSSGADGIAGNDDDLIYDGRKNKVVKREDLGG